MTVAMPDRLRQNQGKTEAQRLRESEQILRDRNAGMQISDLCDKYGQATATIYRRINQALDERISLTVDAYRKGQDEVLDNLMARHEQSLLITERMVEAALNKRDLSTGMLTPDIAAAERALIQRTKVLDSILRVSERRSRLHGLDRPVAVDITVTEQTEQDAELAELIRQAKAKAAVVESELVPDESQS